MTENREQRSRLWAVAMLVMALALGIALTATSVVVSASTTTLPAQGSVGPHLRAAPLTTDTPTPTPTAILVGHVIWEGVPQPSSGNVQPISLTLSMGGAEINYPNQNTDASGFFTVSVAGLPNGTYDYRTKGTKNLAKAGTVTFTGAPTTQLDIGRMGGGDANNDNIVDTIDYAILKANFGRSCQDPLFDARADFNNNCVVNTTDFGILKGDFGLVGAPPDGPVAPSNGNAFLMLQPGSTAGNCPAPANGGTVQVGCRFVLDLVLNMGSVPDGVAQQSYLTFTNSIIQHANINSIASSCVLTSTVTPDYGVTDATLQNQICNGPGNCVFRGVSVAPGSMTYASGALANPPHSGTFRVASIGLCAVAEGQAVLHWQFSPQATRDRHTDIVDADGNLAQDQTLFTDYVINVVAPNLTSTPTPIPTVTPVATGTNTPLPAGVISGHLMWQGLASVNRPLVTGTLALCVSGSQQSFGPFNTDTNGFFTLITNLPDGTYNWFIKGGRHISNSSPTDGATLVISGGQATQEFGWQRGGDVVQTGSNLNIDNATDFVTLKNTFGTGGEWPSDLDYNRVVNITDLSILRSNYGQSGHTLTCP